MATHPYINPHDPNSPYHFLGTTDKGEQVVLYIPMGKGILYSAFSAPIILRGHPIRGHPKS